MFISTYNLTVGATGVNMKVKYSERSNGNTVCRGAGYKVFTYNLQNRTHPECQLEWFGLWVGSTRYVQPRVRGNRDISLQFTRPITMCFDTHLHPRSQ